MAFKAILFDWGGTLMSEDGPLDISMGLWPEVRRVSLLEYITDIFCFTELGVRKDSPEFWSHVLATLKARPEEVAMIGDTLEQDVFPPRRHGVFSVWFNEGGRNPSNPGSIPTVERLPQAVPILMAKGPE